MQKFPGQGSNLLHSSNLGHSNDNTVSLTIKPPGNPLKLFFFFFLGLALWHMKVPGLRVKLELQRLARSTAMAMPNLSPICDLVATLDPNPLSEARDTSWILNLLSHYRNSPKT